MDEPKRRPRDDALLALVVDLGQHAPELARRLEQLSDLLPLLVVAVAASGIPARRAARLDPKSALQSE